MEVGSGVVLWTTAFLAVRKVFPRRSFDFGNRIISTIHALVAVRMGMASLSEQDWNLNLSSTASSPSQMKALTLTLSYLIYDLICCFFDDKRNPSMDNAVHHIVSIVGIGAGLSYRRCGTEMVASLCITEISSPFLHLREILKEMGFRDTNLNFAADISFAVTFSVARMLFGPYLLYITFTRDHPILIKAMALGLQLVSTFWFYRIARMIRYKVAKRITPVNLKINQL